MLFLNIFLRKSVINPHDLNAANATKLLSNEVLDDPSSRASRSSTLIRQCQSSGETQKLIHGMFENYLNMNFKDTRLAKVSSKCCAFGKWIWSDQLLTKIMFPIGYEWHGLAVPLWFAQPRNNAHAKLHFNAVFAVFLCRFSFHVCRS